MFKFDDRPRVRSLADGFARSVASSVAVSSGGGVPATALTYNGAVLTYNGENLTYTEGA
jgi:hypothetical protein